MHPYIPHLLDDIAKAHRPNLPDKLPPVTLEEEFEAIDRWVKREEPEHTLNYYCGLKVEDFPPANQLKNNDLKTVCKAFKKMLFSWNLNTDFPKALPPSLYYNFLINTLNEQTTIPNIGFMTFDYCSGNAPDCVFKEYCPCLEYWNETEKDMPTGTNQNKLPF